KHELYLEGICLCCNLSCSDGSNKKETGRCPGGNTTGKPRFRGVWGKSWARIPPTVNKMVGSMVLDVLKPPTKDIESANLPSVSCTLSTTLNGRFSFFRREIFTNLRPVP